MISKQEGHLHPDNRIRFVRASPVLGNRGIMLVACLLVSMLATACSVIPPPLPPLQCGPGAAPEILSVTVHNAGTTDLHDYPVSIAFDTTNFDFNLPSQIPNPATEKPYWQEEIEKKHIKPAAEAAGLGTGIGWHTFRLTYRTLLDETGAPMKVQQELMRHASIQTTMNVYGQALSSTKRQANSKVVQMVLKPTVAVQTNEKGADVAAP